MTLSDFFDKKHGNDMDRYQLSVPLTYKGEQCVCYFQILKKIASCPVKSSYFIPGPKELTLYKKFIIKLLEDHIVYKQSLITLNSQNHTVL